MSAPQWVMVPTEWLEQRALPKADDYLLPAWQRAAFLAMARMRRDGHAHFASGELAKLLDATPQNTRRAVKEAIDKQWLSPESRTSRMRCLVVPLDFTHGLGRFPKPCSLHRESRGTTREKRSDSDYSTRGIVRDKWSGSDYFSSQDLTTPPAESRGSGAALSLILPNVPTVNRTDGFGLTLHERRAVSLGRRGALVS